MSGWRFETNSAYSAMLPVKDASSEYIARGANLTQYFDVGDYVVAKVTNVTSQKLVDLSTKGPGLNKLRGGRIVAVNCFKVPRVIGKQGSMVKMIKDATGCRITVGQNGLLWISGSPKNEAVAVSAIRMIEKYSHTKGLTDKVKEFLDSKVVPVQASKPFPGKEATSATPAKLATSAKPAAQSGEPNSAKKLPAYKSRGESK